MTNVECKKHINNQVKWYCAICNTPLCFECKPIAFNYKIYCIKCIEKVDSNRDTSKSETKKGNVVRKYLSLKHLRKAYILLLLIVVLMFFLNVSHRLQAILMDPIELNLNLKNNESYYLQTKIVGSYKMAIEKGIISKTIRFKDTREYKFFIEGFDPQGNAVINVTLDSILYEKKTSSEVPIALKSAMKTYMPSGLDDLKDEVVVEYDSKNPPEVVSSELIAKAGLVGKSFNITLSKKGKVLSVIGMDNIINGIYLSYDMQKKSNSKEIEEDIKGELGSETIKHYFESVLSIYPDKKVKIGDTWEIDNIEKYDLDVGINAFSIKIDKTKNKGGYYKLTSVKNGKAFIGYYSKERGGGKENILSFLNTVKAARNLKGEIEIETNSGLILKDNTNVLYSDENIIQADKNKNICFGSELSLQKSVSMK